MRRVEPVASTASPSAPPTWAVVLTSPEARPASSGCTSFMAASSIGLKAMPAPTPSNTIAGKTSTRKFPSTGARAKSASPEAAISKPAAKGPRIPQRTTMRADAPSDMKAMIRLPGRKERPTCMGVYPSTSCM